MHLLILFTFAIMGAFNSKGEDHPFSMNVDELIKAIKARNPSTCRSNSSKNTQFRIKLNECLSI